LLLATETDPRVTLPILHVHTLLTLHQVISDLVLVYLSGTRIIYERKFLLELRNSPLSRTPPQNLPLIPGVTCDEKVKPASPKDNGEPATEMENDKNDHGM